MLDVVVEKEDLEIEFFREHKMAEVTRYFRRRQCFTVALCIAVLVLSQIDLKLSTNLLSSAINKEVEIATTQTIHMTTALFLFGLGAFLEYNPWLDWIIFVITATVVVAKGIQGYEKIANLNEHGIQQKSNIYEYVPFEVVFPICNSIKYVQVVYIAKWVGKHHWITVISLFFILLGLYQYAVFFTFRYIENSSDDKDEINVNKAHFEAWVDIVSACLLTVIALVQLCFLSMDPLDSDLILYEQCIYLSSMYALPKVNKVMRVSDFLSLIEDM